MRHQDEIALVLTDMGLPKLGGWNAFLEMKQMRRGVKVIFASGYVDPKMREEIEKVDGQYFIQKPYVPNDLLKKICEVLDHRASE